MGFCTHSKSVRKIATLRNTLMLFLILTVFGISEAFAQNQKIEGTVKDASSKRALSGATIQIKQLRLGAVADKAGKFSFQVPAGKHNVEISYIGYRTEKKIVDIKDNTVTLSIDMSEQASETSEVVVTSLSGDVKKEILGNAISIIGSASIENTVSSNAIDALSGQVTGAYVTRNSGQPGAGTYVTLRGRKTISGSSEPLYVVDGVIMDNSALYDPNGATSQSNRAVDINPNDIEKMEILKGASAAAMYGSLAGNGVILITTKKGQMTDESKPARITYNSSYTSEKYSGNVPLQTTFGQTTPYAPGKPGSTTSYGAALPAGTLTYNNASAPFRQGVGNEQSISVSGGVPQFDYLINGTYYNNVGYVEGSQLTRSSLRANISASILPGLSIANNLNFINSDNDLPQDGSNRSGILLGSLRTPANFNNLEYLEADGTQRRFAGYDNPIWTQKFNKYNSKINRTLNSTILKWNLNSWINLSANYAFDHYNNNITQRLAVGSGVSESRAGLIDFTRIYNKQENLDFTSNFNLSEFLGDNINSNLVIGGQTIWSERSISNINSKQTLSFFDQVGAGSSKNGSSGLYKSQIFGIFSQLTTTYIEKYTITLGIRRDASSMFGESQQYHYYPKMSFSYMLSNESFFDSFKKDGNTLKVRAAYGEAGSPSLPGAYATNSLYGTSGFFDPWGRDDNTASRGGFIGIRQGGGAVNESIVAGAKTILPELTIEREVGIDLSLMDNRLVLEANYFYSNVLDMILAVPVPSSTGFDMALRNGGSMWNQGYELSLKINPIREENLSWNTILNYTSVKNQVYKLNISTNQDADAYISLNGGFTGMQNIARVGQPLGVFLGYGWLRDSDGKIFHSGDFTLNTPDKRDSLDANKRYIRATKAQFDAGNATELTDDYVTGMKNAPKQDAKSRILGNPNPTFQIGWRNDFTIMKDFTLGFLFDAAFGFDVWNGTRGALYNFGTSKDTEDRNDPWFNENGDKVLKADGTQATRQVYYQNHGNGFNINEPFVEKASYIKLRELNIAYSYKGLKDWNITALIIKFTARNLLTITDYKGYDPEVNTFSNAEGRGFDYFSLPQVKSYRLSLSVNY